MSAYLAVKALHVACVALGGLGFLLRGLVVLSGRPLPSSRWLRLVPHANDTLLLTAGIALAWMSRQYPFVDAWLTAKVLAVTAYVVLGSVALKVGRRKGVRFAAWLGGMAVYGYVISVALLKNPFGFLALTWGGG